VTSRLLRPFGTGFAASAQSGASGPAAPTAAPTIVELLFHERWWLSAVTQGQFREVTVTNNGRVVGRLPFVITRKMGLTMVRMPPFTHVAGPAVDAGEGKPQTQLLRRLSIVRDLIDQLPPFDSFKCALRATTADGLAFQDRGYQISPQYSFRIDCRRDPREIWQDMHFKTRQHIRRAEEKFSVVALEDPDEFVRFYEANVRKQGRTNQLNFASFGAVYRESRARDSGEILCATWPGGAPTAMVFLVWGHGSMYYLLSSRASDAGDNGSINLLIWAAIKRAHERHIVLDLDGVSSSGTARFLSGFGGHLEMRLIARRSRFIYSALQYAKRRLVAGQADETAAFT
jgi:CelD/BcsL family acetyltransferase involved in cellulose biosynthesis